jgi:hypothetical protein
VGPSQHCGAAVQNVEIMAFRERRGGCGGYSLDVAFMSSEHEARVAVGTARCEHHLHFELRPRVMIGDDRESEEGRAGDGKEKFSHRWREKSCLAWQGNLQRM